MQAKEMVDEFRRGFAVKRCHTYPIHGEYSVGSHTVNMLVIGRYLSYANGVLTPWHEILIHDIPEQYTGDLQTHVKRDNPELKKIMTDVEDTWFERLGFDEASYKLEGLNKKIVKAADLLEFFAFCIDQKQLGNNIDEQAVKCVEYLEPLYDDVLGVKELTEGFQETYDAVGRA